MSSVEMGGLIVGTGMIKGLHSLLLRDPPSPAPRPNLQDAAGFVVVVTELAASLPFACLAVLTFSASLCPIAITSFYGNKV